jgi:hypothetical protein
MPRASLRSVWLIGQIFSLLQCQRQTELLAHDTGKEAANRVLLPAGCLPDDPALGF